MSVQKQIKDYIASQPAPKQADLETLNRKVLEVMPGCKLWFLDGKDASGKTVSNPNIGYGTQTLTYADGTTKEFYQTGLSANSTGISVYIMGIADKAYLPGRYSKTIGKASVTGYCIKFKKLSDIDLDILADAIRDGVESSANER